MSKQLKHTHQELKEFQSYPLSTKLSLSIDRIRGWVSYFGENHTYISFSGGKDSTVLLDIIRNHLNYTDIPAVFIDVPTQYPELRDFVNTFSNTITIHPASNFFQTCERYGFPLISKEISSVVYGARKYISELPTNPTPPYQYHYEQLTHTGAYTSSKRYASYKKWQPFLYAPFEISSECCRIMKKYPIHKFARQNNRAPITGQMAEESLLRQQKWLQYGCNAFDLKEPISNPLSFWTEQDILQYIHDYNLPICSVYGKVQKEDNKLFTTGCSRTGCVLCGFGCHIERGRPTRFERLAKTHPKMYNIINIASNSGYTYKQALDWINSHNKEFHIRKIRY